MSDTAATPTSLAHLGLPPADQIGFVVRDLNRAIAQYSPLFGPLHQIDIGRHQMSYRGEPHSDYHCLFAFGKSGDMEIELIQWVEGNTPHRDFLEAGHEGMHHLRFTITGLEDWITRFKALGYELAWYNRASPDLAVAYLDRAGDPLTIELLEGAFDPFALV